MKICFKSNCYFHKKRFSILLWDKVSWPCVNSKFFIISITSWDILSNRLFVFSKWVWIISQNFSSWFSILSFTIFLIVSKNSSSLSFVYKDQRVVLSSCIKTCLFLKNILALILIWCLIVSNQPRWRMFSKQTSKITDTISNNYSSDSNGFLIAF